MGDMAPTFSYSDSILDYILFLFFKFYMYKCFVCLCVDVPQMCRVPKKGAEFPELELQVAVNCQGSAGNWTLFSERTSSVLTHWAVSPAPCLYFHWYNNVEEYKKWKFYLGLNFPKV